MSDEWHLLQDGQQYGPYTGEQLVQFVSEGRIVRESMLWTEGMAEWAKAEDVQGLFPPAPVPVAAAAAPAYVPGGNPPPWMRGGAVAATPQMRPLATAQVRPAMGGGFGGMLMRATPGENYPRTDIKPAWFGLLVTLFGGGAGLILLIGALAIGGVIKLTSIGELGMLLLVIVAGILAMVVAGIIQLVYLARAWSCLAYSDPRTTPGKAVGFMFIPGFNLYWIFVAIKGFAEDWNRIVSQHPDLARAPRMSEGVFLTYCIGTIIAPLGMVMWLPMMAQVCKAINFMAFRPTQHPGTFNIR
jgi:hypothetical protein